MMSHASPSPRRFYLLVAIVAGAIVFWPDADVGRLVARARSTSGALMARVRTASRARLLVAAIADTTDSSEPPARVPDWLYARRWAARGMLVYRAAASTPPNPIAWRFAYVVPVARTKSANGMLLLDTAAFPRVSTLFDSATTFQGLGFAGEQAGLRISGQEQIQRALRYRRQGYAEDAMCFPTLRVAVPRGPELVRDAPTMLGLRAGWAEAVRLESWTVDADSAHHVDEARRVADRASSDTILDIVRVPFTIVSVEHAVADGRELVIVQAERRAFVRGYPDSAAKDSVPYAEFVLALGERNAGDPKSVFAPVWAASLVSPVGVATDISPTWRLALMRAGQPRRLTLVTETREPGKEQRPTGQLVVRGDDGRWRAAGTWRESGCW